MENCFHYPVVYVIELCFTVTIYFYVRAGCDSTGYRRSNGWFSRPIFATTQNSRLRSSCRSNSQSWTKWPSCFIFGTEWNGIYSNTGRQKNQVIFHLGFFFSWLCWFHPFQFFFLYYWQLKNIFSSTTTGFHNQIISNT